MDEDCLNLNIWTQSLDPKAKKPVLVWLHGGGYFAGSSIEQVAYDGYNMCMDGDVVVVSVNHRRGNGEPPAECAGLFGPVPLWKEI